MSRMQREKGKRYERDIARVLRAAFAGADVHRSSQADRARNSDVVATGHPVLECLWLELQDARHPTPVAKLEQAERDIAARRAGRLPVVIWHRIRERASQVTTRLSVIDELRGLSWRLAMPSERLIVVTLDLTEFVRILRAAIRRADDAKEASMARPS